MGNIYVSAFAWYATGLDAVQRFGAKKIPQVLVQYATGEMPAFREVYCVPHVC